MKHIINDVNILRLLNNIADTNEPTNIAIKLHRELFGDDDDSDGIEDTSKSISINHNLIQRKHEQSAVGEKGNSKMFIVNAKEIDSITRASSSTSTEKFNEFASTNRLHKTATETASSLSCFQSLKSFFKCTATVKKISARIESNYPLNLHLRMNQIFSMHDKLCEIAEFFNDLYAIGMYV